MTIEAEATVSYQRAPGALWRDTGRHVLVAPEVSPVVIMLGGGGAAVWRHLERSGDAHDLRSRFAEEGEPPEGADLVDYLDRLCAMGVLEMSVNPTGDRP